MLNLWICVFMLGSIIASLEANQNQESNPSADLNIAGSNCDTQNTRELEMTAQLNDYIDREFLNDDAKTGIIAAVNDLIDKGCYFYSTFEENEWMLLGMYYHLCYSVSKDDLKKYIETKDWSTLNALYTYREVANRTTI
jgi:hypothetical protein